MIHAIIDIGSNTIRMAVYRVENDNIELLIKKKHAVGLAAHIRGNLMQQEGIDLACRALLDFKMIINLMNIKNITAFATAAVRGVNNSRDILKQFARRTGIIVKLLDGKTEAMYAFSGAVRATSVKKGVMMDIGGASTELVVYTNYQAQNACSLPVGSLSIYHKYVKDILPTAAEITAIKQDVAKQLAQLDKTRFPTDEYADICGIGGTFKGAFKLARCTFGKRAAAEMPISELAELIIRFTIATESIPNDVLEVLLTAAPERIKTIVPGMVIAKTLAEYFGCRRIVLSNSGVREGYLYNHIIKRS